MFNQTFVTSGFGHYNINRSFRNDRGELIDFTTWGLSRNLETRRQTMDDPMRKLTGTGKVVKRQRQLTLDELWKDRPKGAAPERIVSCPPPKKQRQLTIPEMVAKGWAKVIKAPSSLKAEQNDNVVNENQQNNNVAKDKEQKNTLNDHGKKLVPSPPKTPKANVCKMFGYRNPPSSVTSSASKDSATAEDKDDSPGNGSGIGSDLEDAEKLENDLKDIRFGELSESPYFSGDDLNLGAQEEVVTSKPLRISDNEVQMEYNPSLEEIEDEERFVVYF